MFYPEDFKERVKKAYPDSQSIHRLLEDGDPMLGLCLEWQSPKALSLKALLSSKSIKELEDKTKIAQEKADIFDAWCMLYDEQH